MGDIQGELALMVDRAEQDQGFCEHCGPSSQDLRFHRRYPEYAITYPQLEAMQIHTF